jgi:hypothetical protein
VAVFLLDGPAEIDHLNDAFHLHLVPPAGERAEHAQILPSAEVFVKDGGLVDRTDLLQRRIAIFLHAAPADAHLARVRPHHAERDAHDGALARAVVAEKAEDFALANFKAHIIQRQTPGGPALGEMSDFEKGHGVRQWRDARADASF